jgi:hypothetical protein
MTMDTAAIRATTAAMTPEVAGMSADMAAMTVFYTRRTWVSEGRPYSTVTLFARFRGWSTSAPRRTPMK